MELSEVPCRNSAISVGLCGTAAKSKVSTVMKDLADMCRLQFTITVVNSLRD